MKKICLTVFITALFLTSYSPTLAIVDPLANTNNKLGIHILSPDEVNEAAKLVNNNGSGSWGYVTVPIQSTDRNRTKWVEFMKSVEEHKLIPIIRVATNPTGSNWDKPNNYDLVDFANFLNDLPWPTKNRYVIIYNEVNRSGEWGGVVSPEEYADILDNAITIFKQRSEDFFMLPAGLDNAAPNGSGYIDWRTYLTRMGKHKPGIFERIDGWTSHSYPNPGFTGKPWDTSTRSVNSFATDLLFLKQYTNKKLPVFITEAGWDISKVGEDQAAYNLRYSFEKVWNNEQIVAITPFLLRAGDGPFVIFSFINMDGSPSKVYREWQSLSMKGDPVMREKDSLEKILTEVIPKVAEVGKEAVDGKWMRSFTNTFDRIFILLGAKSEKKTKTITINGRPFYVELADTPLARQRGLSGREKLAKDEGMLFVFNYPSNYAFWMKDMKFDIDLVYIFDRTVVDIKRGEYKNPWAVISSAEKFDKVLEVLPDSKIKVGDVVEGL